ncbi:hypothetical protein BGX38DRAFT_1223681 [Terfezia claveryi]|nr:hypothetical protein BGX38DRAFT_1223681 [Terfezia claveryi]
MTGMGCGKSPFPTKPGCTSPPKGSGKTSYLKPPFPSWRPALVFVRRYSFFFSSSL